MRKSTEKLQELPKVDYSNLPQEIMGAISNTSFIIERKTKLTWDGKQFSMRIPSEIAEEMHISKENQVFFRLVKPRPDDEGGSELTIRIV